MTRIYQGEPRTIIVTYPDNPLGPLGIPETNITRASMNLKRDTATDADDAYLEHTLADGGVTHDATTHTFAMQLQPADTQSLELGDYELVLAVATDADGTMIELAINQPTITITPDKQRA